MNKLESVLENETHKILTDFEIQTSHLIPTRRPDQEMITKKDNMLHNVLCRPRRPQSENQRKRKERQVFGPCQNPKKFVNIRIKAISTVIGARLERSPKVREGS